jgi:hypothetical protein
VSDLVIEQLVVVASMSEARLRLDAALKEQFPGGMLQRRWEGEVLHLTGPGARGTIVYEAGRLVGRAELKPPASLMRPVIEKKILAALAALAG